MQGFLHHNSLQAEHTSDLMPKASSARCNLLHFGPPGLGFVGLGSYNAAHDALQMHMSALQEISLAHCMKTEHRHVATLITRMLHPSHGCLLSCANGPSTEHAMPPLRSQMQPGHGAIAGVVDSSLDVCGVEAWTLPHSLTAEYSTKNIDATNTKAQQPTRVSPNGISPAMAAPRKPRPSLMPSSANSGPGALVLSAPCGSVACKAARAKTRPLTLNHSSPSHSCLHQC